MLGEWDRWASAGPPASTGNEANRLGSWVDGGKWEPEARGVVFPLLRASKGATLGETSGPGPSVSLKSESLDCLICKPPLCANTNLYLLS